MKPDPAGGSRGGPPDPGTPLPMPIVVGVPRSGTTLLRFMLDSHPSLAIPPETGFLAPLAASPVRAIDEVFDVITGWPPESPAWPDFGIDAQGAPTRASRASGRRCRGSGALLLSPLRSRAGQAPVRRQDAPVLRAHRSDLQAPPGGPLHPRDPRWARRRLVATEDLVRARAGHGDPGPILVRPRAAPLVPPAPASKPTSKCDMKTSYVSPPASSSASAGSSPFPSTRR